MKIGIAQIDTVAGDFAATAERVVNMSRQAVIEGVELLVFPACVLTGPLCLPYAEQGRQMMDLLELFKDLSSRVACPCILPVTMMVNGQMICEAFYVSVGEVLPMRISAYLRYVLARSVQDNDTDASESRLQENLMRGVAAFEFADMNLAVVFDYDDLDTLGDYDFDVDAVIYIPTSGYAANDPSSVLGSAIMEGRFREDVRTTDIWLVAVGSLGCYDTQVFSGGSFVLAPWGELAAVAPAFEEALITCEIGPVVERPLSNPIEPEVYNHAFHCWETLSLGVRDFVHKLGLTGVSLLLDGTLSSMALAVLATDALGPTNVNVLLAMPLEGTKLYEKRSRSVASNVQSSGNQTSEEVMYKAWQRVLAAARRTNVCRQVVANLRVCACERDENLVRATASLLDSAHSDKARLAAVAVESDVVQAELLALARRTGTLALSSHDKTWLALEADGGPLGLSSNSLSASAAAGLLPFGDIYRSDVLQMAHMRNTISPMIPEVILLACDIPLLSDVAPRGLATAATGAATGSAASAMASAAAMADAEGTAATADAEGTAPQSSDSATAGVTATSAKSSVTTGSACPSALKGLSKELQLQRIDAVLGMRLEEESSVKNAASTCGGEELVEAVLSRMEACAVARQAAGPILKASSAPLTEVRRPYAYAWHEQLHPENGSSEVSDIKSLLRYVGEHMGYAGSVEIPDENLAEMGEQPSREFMELMGTLADMSIGMGAMEIGSPKNPKNTDNLFQFGGETQFRWDGLGFFHMNPFSEN